MKMARVVLSLMILVCLVFALPAASAQQVMQARIHLADKAQMKDVVRLNLDVAYVAPLEPHQLRNETDRPFGFFCIVDRLRDRPMKP